jgi:hypothetical protein
MQLVAIIAYCALAAEFLARYTWDRPVIRFFPVPGEVPRGAMDKRLKRMLQAMLVMTIFIIIRYVFLPFLFSADPDGLQDDLSSNRILQWVERKGYHNAVALQ